MVASRSQAVDPGGLLDCHCHLIPGVDDGPAGIEESLEIAAVLASFGFTRVYCTPHLIKGAYDNHPERIQEETRRLQEALDLHNIPVAIHPAAEYYLDEYLQVVLRQPLRLWDSVILLEAHRYVPPTLLAETAYTSITEQGLCLLIAHPERYELLSVPKAQSKSSGFLSSLWPGRASNARDQAGERSAENDENIFIKLRDMGCLLQGNIGSFAGIYGEQVRKRALALLQRGLYDLVATDAHHARGLTEWLKSGLEVIEQEIGREGLTRLLRLPENKKEASG